MINHRKKKKSEPSRNAKFQQDWTTGSGLSYYILKDFRMKKNTNFFFKCSVTFSCNFCSIKDLIFHT